VSVAAYLRPPSARDALGDTKLTFNAGKGIKEPSLVQELSSLFVLFRRRRRARSASSRSDPSEPQHRRGIEQGVAAGRGRSALAYFNNEFLDLDRVRQPDVLPQLGVPSRAAAVAASAPT
jgi:hypothetical protein